jgi:hypothetical protein
VPNQDDLGWLEEEAAKPEWSIVGEDNQPVCALTPAGLEAVAGSLPVTPALRLLAARGDLQRRIRSATACYLDLGDFAAATSVEGGYLIHVLSDQQWCRHWMVYLDAAGHEAVVTSTDPIGFDLPADWPPPPRAIPLGNGAIELDVCADSFAEFAYRFWIENEIFFAHHENRPLAAAAASYAALLPAKPAASDVKRPGPGSPAQDGRSGGGVPPYVRSRALAAHAGSGAWTSLGRRAADSSRHDRNTPILLFRMPELTGTESASTVPHGGYMRELPR